MPLRNRTKLGLNAELGSPNSPQLQVLDAKSIDKRFLELKKFLVEQMKSFGEQMKAFEDRVFERIGALTAELTNLRTEFKTLRDDQRKLDKKFEDYDTDFGRLQVRVNAIESTVVASEAILFNVPNAVDASNAFTNIAKTISFEANSAKKVFRTRKPMSNDKSVPIIIKLKRPDDRIKLMRCISEFKKKNKRQLNFADGTIDGVGELFIRECLTDYNKQLFHAAAEYKKKLLLDSVFSLRGNIFVKKRADDRAVKLLDMNSLLSFVGGLQ